MKRRPLLFEINFFDITFNDFDNTGSLQEANRSNLRFDFQKGPQTTDQKMLNSCERNIDISQVGSKNNGCNQKNRCFELLNGAIGKLLLVCNKSKRTCLPDNSSDRLLSALIASAFLIWLFRTEGKKL